MRRQTSAEQGGQMWEAACYQLWFSLKEKRLVAAHMLVAYICMLYISVGWLGSFLGNLIVFHISPDLLLENHMFFMRAGDGRGEMSMPESEDSEACLAKTWGAGAQLL